ncbi:MAG: hypothetical protein LBS55_13650, partial [Prevotellaceae bacterium]|jgi:hypothetical protein|nr:hypothetical protein [Prevotellaceae bacterium]
MATTSPDDNLATACVQSTNPFSNSPGSRAENTRLRVSLEGIGKVNRHLLPSSHANISVFFPIIIIRFPVEICLDEKMKALMPNGSMRC